MDEYTNETPRQRVHRRKSALWTERSSWDTEWREISELSLIHISEPTRPY